MTGSIFLPWWGTEEERVEVDEGVAISGGAVVVVGVVAAEVEPTFEVEKAVVPVEPVVVFVSNKSDAEFLSELEEEGEWDGPFPEVPFGEEEGEGFEGFIMEGEAFPLMILFVLRLTKLFDWPVRQISKKGETPGTSSSLSLILAAIWYKEASSEAFWLTMRFAPIGPVGVILEIVFVLMRWWVEAIEVEEEEVVAGFKAEFEFDIGVLDETEALIILWVEEVIRVDEFETEGEAFDDVNVVVLDMESVGPNIEEDEAIILKCK